MPATALPLNAFVFGLLSYWSFRLPVENVLESSASVPMRVLTFRGRFILSDFFEEGGQFLGSVILLVHLYFSPITGGFAFRARNMSWREERLPGRSDQHFLSSSFGPNVAGYAAVAFWLETVSLTHPVNPNAMTRNTAHEARVVAL